MAIALVVTAIFAPPPLGAALALTAAIACGRINPRVSGRQPTGCGAGRGGVVAAVFLPARPLNQDGAVLTRRNSEDVPVARRPSHPDEALELFLHSRVWHYTNRWWHWSVVFSCQVVSCVAGSVFVYGLLRLSRLAPARSWLFLAGALSGGYIQLFFSDAENYTPSPRRSSCCMSWRHVGSSRRKRRYGCQIRDPRDGDVLISRSRLAAAISRVLVRRLS